LLAEVRDQVAAVSRRKGALQSEMAELQAGLQQAQTELRAQEVSIATHEGEFKALCNSQRLLDQKVETVMYEIQSLAAQEQEGLAKRQALADRLGSLTALEEARQQQVAEGGQRLEALRHEREAANTALTESRVALATAEQLLSAARQQLQGLQNRITELTQAIDQRRAELSSFVARREQAQAQIQESEARIEACVTHAIRLTRRPRISLRASRSRRATLLNGKNSCVSGVASLPTCSSVAEPWKLNWHRRGWPFKTFANESSKSITFRWMTFAANASRSLLPTKDRPRSTS
jgi:chromosome segregation ATPase